MLRDQCYQLFPSDDARSLNLEIKETPTVAWDGFAQEPKKTTPFGFTMGDWAIVEPLANGNDDATPRIQAAMNSGKTTVYLKKGFYTIHSTVEIGGKVRRFHGGWCTMAPAGDLLAGSDPMFNIKSGTQDTVVIQCIRKRGGSWFGKSTHSFIRNNSTKTVVLGDIMAWVCMGYSSAVNTGPVYIEQFSCGGPPNVDRRGGQLYDNVGFDFNNEVIYARCLNPEGFGKPKVRYSRSDGKMVCLGFKAGERNGPYFEFTNGCSATSFSGAISMRLIRPTLWTMSNSSSTMRRYL